MRRSLFCLVMVVGCGSSEPATPEDAALEDGAVTDAAVTDAAVTDASPDGLADTGGGDGSSDVAGPSDIATWTDGPGTCPTGSKKVELSTTAQLIDASRGEGAYAADPPDVCYLVKNGTYNETTSILFFVKKGGTAGAPRRFVGESRDKVVVRGRANAAAAHVVFESMTFDLTGYVKSGSFNTFDVAASDVTIRKVTFTGDCATGSKGGHIEVNAGDGITIDSCIVEKFGHCGPTGHLDHGIYLANGSNITVRNSIIRGNASRGIQLYTQSGDYGKVLGARIEGNRIYGNGHADYEDGIVIDAQGTGDVNDVVVERNLIYDNYFSGVRFVGSVTNGILIRRNTFYGNGQRSTHTGRSSLNLDEAGSGGKTLAEKNLLVGAKAMLNDCYDATPRGFSVADNVIWSSAVTTGGAGCVGKVLTLDPGFVDPTKGDFHTGAAVAGYGAY